MSYGCSVWPAFWTVGANWPDGGEIDIVEGVNNNPTLVLFLASPASPMSPLCAGINTLSIPAVGLTVLPLRRHLLPQMAVRLSRVMYLTWTAEVHPRMTLVVHCPIPIAALLVKTSSGVFALLRDDNTGIKIWHFARNSIPLDAHSGKPDPSSWPPSSAFLSTADYDIASHFSPQHLVLDTTLCGGWGGGEYPSSGCPGSCAEHVSKGENFVGMSFTPPRALCCTE